MFNNGIVAAMEDENAANQTELAIDEAGADSMEADLVETVDLAANIDQGTSEVERTMKDADQLERHVEVLTEAEGEGGASPEVVETTEIAVEHIYNRLGIYGKTGIPAMESFTTVHGKASNTRVAIEAISENIKRIWEAVKMAFKKLVNYVKDFFAKLFDANAKMLSRVTSLRAKVAAVKGNPGKNVPASGIKGVVNSADLKNAKQGAGVGQISAAAKGMSELANEIPAAVKGVESDAAFNAYSYSPTGKPAAKAQAPDGMQWTALMTVGTATVALLEPKAAKKGKEAYAAAQKASAKVFKAEAKGDGNLPVLDVASMKAVLDGVEESVKELMNQKSTIATAQSNLDKAVAEINKIASGGDKEDKELSNRSTTVRGAVTSMANATIKGLTLTGSEVARVCQGYLTYVERSAASYSESAKDKDAGGDNKDGEGKK